MDERERSSSGGKARHAVVASETTLGRVSCVLRQYSYTCELVVILGGYLRAMCMIVGFLCEASTRREAM